MKKKLLMTAIACLLSLVSVSMAEYAITTADGNGADGGVSNDENQRSTVVIGTNTTAPIRHYDTVRAKATILRFDVGAIGGDISGAMLSFTTTSANRARTMEIWAMTDDSLDNWDEATLSYRTAPGLLPSGPIDNGYDGYDNGIITFDTTKWISLGTMPVAASPATNTGSIDPNYIAADKNGLITLLLYNTPSDGSASYYVAMKEGGVTLPTLTFPNARFATDPIPGNGETALNSLNQLSWTNTEPNDPVNGVISCDVYIGTTEPNYAEVDYGLTKIAAGTTDTTVTIPFALSPRTYYWVVDSHDSSSVPSYLGIGAVWRFNITSAPQITGDPVDQIKLLGQSAEFAITVESTTTVTYTWYQSADKVIGDDTPVGTDSPILTLNNVSRMDEGYYYCKAVNDSGEANAAYSAIVRLVVQRQVAHWTLDSLVSGQYEDSSGEGHHADPNNTNVTFVDGVNAAATNQAVLFNANSFASAGTWNPSYLSGEFTISFWMKWDGSTGEYQNILRKMDTWAADDMMWQLGVSSDNAVNIISSGGGGAYADSPAVGEWEFAAVTFSNGSATIYLAKDGDINFTTSTADFTQGTDVDAAIYLGGSAGGTQLFNGTLDDVQIFNYVKDPIAIADLYNEAVAQDFCLRQYGSSEFNLDVNNNCRIDMADFAEFAKSWLDCGLYPNCP